MTESTKSWSTNQVKFQRWLALPSGERTPKTQEGFASENGVNAVTLSRWKQQPGFMTSVYDIAEEYLGDDMADVYAALRREAKLGSFQHIKLVLELTGRYVERQELTGKGGAALQIEYINDWRSSADSVEG